MKATLLNSRMHDGSRQFAELPESCASEKLRQHIERQLGWDCHVPDYRETVTVI